MRKYHYKTLTWVIGQPLDELLNAAGAEGWRFVHLNTVASVPVRKREGHGYEEAVPGTPLGYVIVEKVTVE